MRKQPQIYKSFLIIPRGDKIQIFDIAGKVYAEADSIADAQEMISEHVSSIVRARKEKKPEKRTYKHLLDNPNLKKMSENALRELQKKIHQKQIPLFDDLIAQGRGHEGFQETMQKQDPTSLALRKLHESEHAIIDEIEGRKKFGAKYYRALKNPSQAFRVLMRDPSGAYMIYEERRKGKKVYVWANGPVRESDLERWKELHAGTMTYYSSITSVPGVVIDASNWNPLIPGSIAPEPKPRKSLKNPPLTKIYDCIKEVIAVKGPGHKCDTACKRANHTYRHVFTKKHGIFGTADGQKLIIE